MNIKDKLKKLGFYSGKDKENSIEEEQLKTIRKDGHYIRFIKNPSKNLQLEAVKQSGLSIQFIKNPSEELQLEAVKKNGNSIEFIKDPSKKIQLEAVKQDGNSIQYIKNPSEEAQLEAIKRRDVFDFIDNPSDNLILSYITLYNNYDKINLDDISDDLANKIYDIVSIKDVLE